jgi:mevalonate kinase
MPVEATAPGKVILFGEHSVVYKGPAIVMAIDRRAKAIANKRDDKRIYFDSLDLGFAGFFEGDNYIPVKGESWRGKRLQALKVSAKKTMEHIGVESGIDLIVRTEIPIAAGLGSSAAICVAIVAAVGDLFEGDLTNEEICEIAYEGEKVVHGTPSGVDNNISTFGGVLRYEKGSQIERFEIKQDLPFIIGNSRRRRSTKRLVDRVRALKEREPTIVSEIINSIAEISENGLQALINQDLHRLGDLMNVNHGLLSSLGVSISKLDVMVHASRGAGAFGAKLTGAGGGGCMIALSESYKLHDIATSIRRVRGEPHIVKISYDGVQTKRVN